MTAILERLSTEATLAKNGDHPILARSFELAIQEIERLHKALSASGGYLMNAKIDLETGAPKRTAIRTIDGGIRLVNEALNATIRTLEEPHGQDPKSSP